MSKFNSFPRLINLKNYSNICMIQGGYGILIIENMQTCLDNTILNYIPMLLKKYC